MITVYEKPKAFNDKISTYCPGCGHGIIQRIIGELIEELGIHQRTVAVLGVGCSSRSWQQMAYDVLSVPHGRPGAAATGIKHCNPNKIVYTYQGDGDAGAIGLSETLYAAVRGENITAIVVNNTVFAMTGGQMAPTTLDGQVTVTSPKGRDCEATGHPLHLPELAAQIRGSKFVARSALYDTASIRNTKKLIKQAFENQIHDRGYSMVEILSPCPSIWRMSPNACMQHIKNIVIQEYPLGILKDE